MTTPNVWTVGYVYGKYEDRDSRTIAVFSDESDADVYRAAAQRIDDAAKDHMRNKLEYDPYDYYVEGPLPLNPPNRDEDRT